jgi:hypothetical protein
MNEQPSHKLSVIVVIHDQTQSHEGFAAGIRMARYHLQAWAMT